MVTKHSMESLLFVYICFNTLLNSQ